MTDTYIFRENEDKNKNSELSGGKKTRASWRMGDEDGRFHLPNSLGHHPFLGQGLSGKGA